MTRHHDARRDRNLRHTDAGPVRPAADRAHQRRVLRDADARARRDLRPAQHHQLHARRPVHDGRVLRVVPARALGRRLLVVAAARADRRRRDRRRHRAHDALAALQARPPVRAAADLRPRADHPGRVHQLLRQLGPALPAARGVRRRVQPRLHVPAEVPRVGDRRFAHRVPRHVVRDRAHQARRRTCAPRPRTRRWCRRSASTCRG